MGYDVSVAVEPRRPMAAVAATTTWEQFSGQWRGMLDEVWACLRQAEVRGRRARAMPRSAGAGMGGFRPIGSDG
jgi:hypothetical protein